MQTKPAVVAAAQGTHGDFCFWLLAADNDAEPALLLCLITTADQSKVSQSGTSCSLHLKEEGLRQTAAQERHCC